MNNKELSWTSNPRSSMVLWGRVKLNSTKLRHQEHGTGYGATTSNNLDRTANRHLHLRCNLHKTMTRHPHGYRHWTANFYSQYNHYISAVQCNATVHGDIWYQASNNSRMQAIKRYTERTNCQGPRSSWRSQENLMPRKHGTKRNLEGTSTTERGSLRLRPTAKQPNAQEPGRRRSPAPAARENDLPMQNLMATLQPSRLICRDSEGCRPCEHVAATETGAQAGANLTSLTRGADPERRERKGEKKSNLIQHCTRRRRETSRLWRGNPAGRRITNPARTRLNPSC